MLLLRIASLTRNEALLIVFYASAHHESVVAKARTQRNDSIDTLLQEKMSAIKIEHPSEINLAFQGSALCHIALSVLDDLCLHHACDYLCSECNAVDDFF